MIDILDILSIAPPFSFEVEGDGPATNYVISPAQVTVAPGKTGTFTIIPNGTFTGTITLSDGSGGGTFSDTTIDFVDESTQKTFTYTNPTKGDYLIESTNDAALDDPEDTLVRVRQSSGFKGVIRLRRRRRRARSR